MTADNPYASPMDRGDAPESAGLAQRPLGEVARTTFIAWEKLRLIYIGVLALVTLAFGFGLDSTIELLGTAVVGAIVANVCYFAGPIVETYVTWLGYRGSWLRTVLFIVGTLFACTLAIASLYALAIPPPASGVTPR